MWPVITFSFIYSACPQLQITTTCLLPPAVASLYPSVQTWCVCVFGVVTARILQRSAYIPFIPDPPGVGPTSPYRWPRVREWDRCRNRQMVGKSTVKCHSCPAHCKLTGFELIMSYQKSCLLWPWRVRNLLRRQCWSCWVIEFGSKTFMSFSKV